LEKIKVVHILHSVGGVEVYLRLVTENINPNKFESIIIHKKNDSKRKYKDKNNVELKEFNIPIQREINIIKDFKAVLKTIAILKKEKPHVIHAHSAKGGIIARLASFFYKVKILHTPHAYSYLSADSFIKKHFFLFLEKLFKNFNSYLLATSESEKQRGIIDVGYKQSKALVFNNSIMPISSIINDRKINLPTKYICTVGRPSFQKNIEAMVNIIYKIKQEIPEIHLVVMGVGEYSPNKEKVVSLIESLDLNKNITLIKWMERDKIFGIIKKSLFYISTSRYEGLPYSVIESLALSKALVLSDCDGNKDLVKDNFNGFLIKNSCQDLMIEKIKLLYLDDDLRKRFETESFNLFTKNFNLINNINLLEDIYLNHTKIE
jgi:glycosyltransferase involved in cell wall biosynthesis